MISYFFRSKTTDTECKELDAFKAGAWVYVDNPTEDELARLATKHDLEEDILLDVLDENEMPRVERDDNDYMYLFTRHPYIDDDLYVTTSPILFIVTDKTLFTIALRRMPRIDKFINAKLNFATTEHIALLLEVLDQIDDEYDAKLNALSRQINAIRSRLRVEEIHNKDFVDFVVIEDVLNDFLTALTPTNSILKRLVLGKHISLHDSHKDLVQDLLLNNEQSIEGCKSNLKTIVSIRDAYSTIMSNNLNRVIRLLTVLTVLLAIPTLITSTYGMNIGLPHQNNPLAFLGVMLFALLLSALLLLFFKLRRWI